MYSADEEDIRVKTTDAIGSISSTGKISFQQEQVVAPHVGHKAVSMKGTNTGATQKIREPGYYWVKTKHGGWRVCQYISEAGVWLIPGSNVVRIDSSLEEIGPRITKD